MKSNSSRRDFLCSGLALPVAGLASSAGFGNATVQSASPPSLAPAPKLAYRTVGKTGLKVTAVGFGCMVTSDASVIERAAQSDVRMRMDFRARPRDTGKQDGDPARRECCAEGTRY